MKYDGTRGTRNTGSQEEHHKKYYKLCTIEKSQKRRRRRRRITHKIPCLFSSSLRHSAAPS
jgi:hypothetical protein